jgi:hypothetical protein
MWEGSFVIHGSQDTRAFFCFEAHSGPSGWRRLSGLLVYTVLWVQPSVLMSTLTPVDTTDHGVCTHRALRTPCANGVARNGDGGAPLCIPAVCTGMPRSLNLACRTWAQRWINLKNLQKTKKNIESSLWPISRGQCTDQGKAGSSMVGPRETQAFSQWDGTTWAPQWLFCQHQT